VSHLVQDRRDGQHQHGVLAGGDLDPIGVSDPEPLQGHLGRCGPAVLDGVLVLDDVALDLEVRAVRYLDGPRSRTGVISAFFTVATVCPSPSSISIVSRTRATRC
jgi:hypothetical protein